MAFRMRAGQPRRTSFVYTPKEEMSRWQHQYAPRQANQGAKVGTTAWEQVSTGRLSRALAASLTREATGFLIGTVGGLLLGALLGLSPWFNWLVGPSFNTFKQISLFA